jgi:uncharacterized membrane protein YcaP (DUF421 family)
VIIIYIFLFVLLKMLGKCHIGDFGPFDIVVLLIFNECVQNALIEMANPFSAAWWARGAVRFKPDRRLAIMASKTAEWYLEGTPRILVRNGQVCVEMLAKERINHNELMEALRREGRSSLLSVRYAVLENNGPISIGLRVERS